MSMNIRFDNKVAVVTGGTAGIGLACAQLFGQLGAKVAICGTNPTKLAAALEELKVQGITTAVTWSVADSSVATVNGSGKVTGVKSGTTTVTASWDGQKATCIVRVKN